MARLVEGGEAENAARADWVTRAATVSARKLDEEWADPEHVAGVEEGPSRRSWSGKRVRG